MDVIIESRPIDVLLEPRPVDAVIESRPVTVEINNARGLPGADGVGEERLLYVVDFTKASGFLGNITSSTIIANTTANTFTLQITSSETIELYCSDVEFFSKILNVSITVKNTADAYGLPITIYDNFIKFTVMPILSTYRISIEFYNF